MTLTNTGSLYGLSSIIVKGFDINQRVGQKIAVYELSFQILLLMNSTLSYDTVRVVVGNDLYPNGLTAAWLDVFTTQQPTSEKNINNLYRFDIYYDKLFNLNSNSPNQTLGDTFQFETPIITIFQIGTTNPTPTTGNMFIAFLAINSFGIVNSLANLTWRLRYSDKTKDLKC